MPTTEQAIPARAVALFLLAISRGASARYGPGRDTAGDPFVEVAVKLLDGGPILSAAWHTRSTGTYRLFGQVRSGRRALPSLTALEELVRSAPGQEVPAELRAFVEEAASRGLLIRVDAPTQGGVRRVSAAGADPSRAMQASWAAGSSGRLLELLDFTGPDALRFTSGLRIEATLTNAITLVSSIETEPEAVAVVGAHAIGT